MSSFSSSEEEEAFEDVNNGLILSDIFFPTEILLNILIFVSWKDLLACRSVCQTWKRIIDSVVSFEKLKRYSLKELRESFTHTLPTIKSDCVPFYLYFAISKGAFGNNLLKNAFGSGDDPHVCERDQNAWRNFQFRSNRSATGESSYVNGLICSQKECPRYLHWGVLSSEGNGWSVEVEPTGSEPLPAHLPGRSCFTTSYGWCIKEQLITLEGHSLNSLIMDQIQPQLDVSEWYARRWDCGIKYKLEVSLLDSNKQVLHTFEEETGDSLQDNNWHQVSHSFKDYGPGVRYILFRHCGRDSQFWAGHYGSKMAGGSVIARIPSSQFEKTCDSISLD
ncbi:F-box only protein 6-like [Macrosteles quadrilineatus]|uniref:F-box only protein 6-like n=1 Tax=Macrosteles quadrilineatus TaxID=74068 RepID=UPI0023E2D010|nr:F-box only protein 6-like [Macrosteles quadrilineatus]